VRAYSAADATSPLKEVTIQRRQPGPKDVVLDVLYCGVCHSDVHQVRDEWNDTQPTHYPSVPGHEVVGRVVAVGEEVTKFKVGDIGGVGCIMDSCRECENCLADREQNCTQGATLTYNSPDTESGGFTLGGYSATMVITEHFVIGIPAGADLAAMAPLLCAGVTTFSPMQHWRLKKGRSVGVVGLGGLGHIAVKLAVARGARVTVFTTSPNKVADAIRLGAAAAVLSTDEAAMASQANQLDLLISTVPEAYAMQPFMNLLKLDGTLVNVGALTELKSLHGMSLAYGRKSLAGSMVGGILETQQVIDYCTARGIKADVEIVTPDQINTAFDRMVNKDVRFRFVIDMKAGISSVA
jgi:uncharacterized zinc-type alcohol dehydrogenase-like protein